MTDHKQKPVLDEQDFEKLLQAAHVLQEHNRKKRELEARMELHNERLREQESASQAPLPEPVKEPTRPSDYTLTLAQIVEAQRQIQMKKLTLESAMAVVAERVTQITGASGAGIGIMEGKKVRYLAGSGAPALPLKTEVPLTTAICAASVRTGQVIRSEDVNVEVLFDPEPCRQRGILSLLAVPIYHDGDIVGALELYFDRMHGFAEQDIHTCQLLAGLVTEALGRDAETAIKKSMAAERSTMLATIEKLQPKLEALAADQSATGHSPVHSSEIATHGPGAGMNGTGGANVAVQSTCWRCGGKLLAEEQFCGKCGAPRASDYESDSMQSKVASAWQRQQGMHETGSVPSNGASHSHDSVSKDLMFQDSALLPKNETENHADFAEHSLQDALARLESQDLESRKLNSNLDATNPHSREKDDWREEEGDEEQDIVPVSAGSLTADLKLHVMSPAETDSDKAAEDSKIAAALVAKQGGDLVWTSAAKTRAFLESLAAARTTNPLVLFWRSRRGDFYLAIALVLLLAVIRWGIGSSHSVSATDHRAAVSSNANHSNPQPAPAPDLSAFDKFLIAVGLAEAPEPLEYKGNPDTQVWVDLHTALYYCPGSELYNKTAKGKLTSQRDAQLDHFEPANRKPCE
ncbi:MAG: GAF domain-containing protein [Candidatus Sulfotelmatobacter sp.]